MSNFYIIGTKYGEHNNMDIFPYLIDRKVVAIGFCWDIDLTSYYNKEIKELDILLRKKGLNGHTIGQVKLFMSLQPGDVLALKSNGSPKGKSGFLEVI